MAIRHHDGAALRPLQAQLAMPAGPVGRALEEIAVAAYMLDRSGEVVWMNQRAKDLLGDRVGRLYTEAVTPDTLPAARTAFTKKIFGTQPQTLEAGVHYAADGERIPVEVNAVAMRSTADIVGVFGFISAKTTPQPRAATAAERGERLTPRQLQILRELACGASTEEIASRLSLSRTTIRNHIAHTLAALGSHTRLQAVLEAQRRGLIG